MASELPEVRCLTNLLNAWSSGNKDALDELVEILYADLHRMAKRHFVQGEGRSPTLQPTLLVHEVYMRLLRHRQLGWRDRGQFYAFAAKLIRQILIDHARERHSLKRGGDLARVPFSHVIDLAVEHDLDRETLIDLDAALAQLEEVDSRQCQVVELRFFAGLTIEQIAEIQQTSRATVKRDWDMAKRWLARAQRKKAV